MLAKIAARRRSSPPCGMACRQRESAWFFTAMDDATEAKLSTIVRKAAS